MERYLIFAWSKQYPQGGFNDFRVDYMELQHAKDAAMHLVFNEDNDESHVTDTVSGQIVYEVTKI